MRFAVTFSSNLNKVEPFEARATKGMVFVPSIIRKTINDRPMKLSQA